MSYKKSQVLRTREPLITEDSVRVPAHTRVLVLAVLPAPTDRHSKRLRVTIVDYQYPDLYRKKITAKIGAFMTTKVGRPAKAVRREVRRQTAFDREVEIAIPDSQYPL